MKPEINKIKSGNQYDCRHIANLHLLLAPLFVVVFLAFSSQAFASFDCDLEPVPVPADCIDEPTAWTDFESTDGYIAPYTYLGQPISDYTAGGDDTNGGGSGVSPSVVDLASGSPDTNPGPYDTPTYGYYNGGDAYDPLDPGTLENDYLLFRMRLAADPSTDNKDDFESRHWNILVDVDDDGYKEFWVDIDGTYSPSDPYDHVQILYNNDNTQLADEDTDRVNEFYAYNSDSFSESFTRVIDIADSTDFFLEVQVPMTAFNDANGNQVLFPDSPVGFVFSTSTSNEDPLQKDWMMDLNYISDNDPITFGDVVIINGEPKLKFVDSSLEAVSFYTVGDDIYFYVKHPAGNTESTEVESITITATNPANNDNEQLTLYESSPNSGLFTNRGAAYNLLNTDCADCAISSITTSTATVSADWELIYYTSDGLWHVFQDTGSGFVEQTATATSGTEYTSDGGEVTFTVYEDSPTDGDVISFSTYPNNPLPSVQYVSGTPTEDDELEVSSTDTIQFSYIYESTSYTAETLIVGDGEPFVQFTRASGLPSTDFQLTDSSSTSDKLYVTVIHDPYLPEYDPDAVDTIQVTLINDPAGTETQTITLTETDVASGIFRNTTGLDTQVSDGTITPNDGLWEDIDSGIVKATYTYDGSPYYTTANLFYINGAGRVYFTDLSGTQDVDLYVAGQSVYIKVEDLNFFDCPDASEPITVTLCVPTSPTDPTCKDTESVDLYETSSGSGFFMNTPDGTAIVTATSAIPDDENQILELSHDDMVIVSYTDCDDGDLDVPNDIKTDTATYMAPPVIINEVLFYPTPDTNETEYFQVYNASGSSIDIYGYTVNDGDGFSYTFPESPDNDLGYPAFTLGAEQMAYVFLYDADLSHNDFYDIDAGEAGIYYLFADQNWGYPSNQFSDPTTSDETDQLLLYDGPDPLTAELLDYVGWSIVAEPTIDFLGDDSPAVTASIWQDDAYLDVSSMSSAGSAIGRISDGYDTNVPSDWTFPVDPSWLFDPDGPGPVITPVVISSFKAFDDNGRVLLRWETSSEVGTIGFYLFRRAKNQFAYELVNTELLPALLTVPQGGTYFYYDYGAVPGKKYSYLIEEVVTTGERLEYGPFKVKAAQRYRGPDFFGEFSSEPHQAAPVTLERLQRRRLNRENRSGRERSHRSRKFSRYRNDLPDALRISVLDTGLYFISASDIAEHFGADYDSIARLINKNRLDLTSQGESVPYFTDRQNPGIYFYGLQYGDIYTDENVYWLTMQSGNRMERESVRWLNHYLPDQSFSENIHFEKDNKPILAQPWEIGDDYWAWDYVRSGSGGYDFKSFNFSTNSVLDTTADANLIINFIGGSREGYGEDHHAEIYLNNSWVGTCLWDGIEIFPCKLPFPQNYLNEGENTLDVEGILEGDVSFSLFYIDSFDIQYQKYYEAADNSLSFHGNGNRAVTITGFAEEEIFLLDVSDPSWPILLENKNRSNTWLSFIPDDSAQYFAVSQSGIRQVDAIKPYNFTGLKQRRNRGRYLIITPAELSETAQELADYRSRQGFETKIVTMEDISNQFNHGLYSPDAIKKFLSHAYRKWSQPPEYVVLIGEGTYDYRDVKGLGDNLMPTMFVPTPNGLFASDNYLADINNDGVPDMAIGRLPVLSDEELLSLINKIKNYERYSGVWSDMALLLADNPEENADFVNASERLSNLIPRDYNFEKIYLSAGTPNIARNNLRDALYEGATFLNYYGHGGPTRFANEGLLLSSDVTSLHSNGLSPVITAMTCLVGEFFLPGFDSISELLLLQPEGGATAIWSPTGFSEHSEARLLGFGFYNAIFNDGETILGDAILQAFALYSLKGEQPYHILIYNLLGDPALRIQ
ncbi:C25 family cysteine peptidase [Thermodesulfobacteriota bacterium]